MSAATRAMVWPRMATSRGPESSCEGSITRPPLRSRSYRFGGRTCPARRRVPSPSQWQTREPISVPRKKERRVERSRSPPTPRALVMVRLASRPAIPGSTADLLAHQFSEQLRPAGPEHVVGQGSFAGQQGGVECGYDPLLADPLLLRGRDQLAVRPPDQG